MPSIYLIRHGETEGNAEKRLQFPDAQLSEKGRWQAVRLARRLAGAGIRSVLSSDHTRALMTAEALADSSDIPIEVEPLLRERDFGSHRGWLYRDIGADIFSKQYLPPGGETWESFCERGARAWRRVEVAAAAAPGPLAVVTHGLLYRRFLEDHLFWPEDTERARCAVHNTALTIVEGGPPWRVELLACTDHLGPDDAPL